MNEKNHIDTLMGGLHAAFSGDPLVDHEIMDAVFEGYGPVKVLVAVPFDAPYEGAVVPLAILLTEDLFDRVIPVGLNRETDEEYAARVGGDAA